MHSLFVHFMPFLCKFSDILSTFPENPASRARVRYKNGPDRPENKAAEAVKKVILQLAHNQS